MLSLWRKGWDKNAYSQPIFSNLLEILESIVQQEKFDTSIEKKQSSYLVHTRLQTKPQEATNKCLE